MTVTPAAAVAQPLDNPVDQITRGLQALSLTQNSAAPAVIVPLPTVKKIEQLVLDKSCGKSPEEILQLLQENPQIHTLKLKSVKLSLAICKQLEIMKELKEVELDGCTQLTEIGLCSIASSKSSFESFSVNNSQFVTAKVTCSLFMRNFSGSRLKKVSFTNCPKLTLKGIKWLAKCALLNEVTLSGCKEITDEAVDCLTQLKQLKVLHIDRCSLLSDEAVRCLLDEFKSLQRLSISFTWYMDYRLFKVLRCKETLALTVTPESMREGLSQKLTKGKDNLLRQLASRSLGKCTFVPLITFFPDREIEPISETDKEHFPLPDEIKINLLSSDLDDYLIDR